MGVDDVRIFIVLPVSVEESSGSCGVSTSATENPSGRPVRRKRLQNMTRPRRCVEDSQGREVRVRARVGRRAYGEAP